MQSNPYQIIESTELVKYQKVGQKPLCYAEYKTYQESLEDPYYGMWAISLAQGLGLAALSGYALALVIPFAFALCAALAFATALTISGPRLMALARRQKRLKPIKPALRPLALAVMARSQATTVTKRSYSRKNDLNETPLWKALINWNNTIDLSGQIEHNMPGLERGVIESARGHLNALLLQEELKTISTNTMTQVERESYQETCKDVETTVAAFQNEQNQLANNLRTLREQKIRQQAKSELSRLNDKKALIGKPQNLADQSAQLIEASKEIYN